MPVGGGKGGGGDSTINVKNSGTTTLDILGLDNINSKTELVLPQPFRTDSTNRTELAVTQPIVTDSTSRNEVAVTQPIVTDSTSDLSLDIQSSVECASSPGGADHGRDRRWCNSVFRLRCSSAIYRTPHTV